VELGMPVVPTDPNSFGIPNINFLNGNLTSYGNPTSSPFQINDKYFEWVDNFSWVIGKHSLRLWRGIPVQRVSAIGTNSPAANSISMAGTPTWSRRRRAGNRRLLGRRYAAGRFV